MGLRRNFARAASAYSRRLRLETLEERRLLAITVTTNLDVVDSEDGVVSLREAIAEANSIAGPDTIDFDFGHDGPETIVLTQGEIRVTHSLTIDGPGSDLLTIDASGSDLTPEVNNGDGSRIIHAARIPGSGTFEELYLSILGLRMTGGDCRDVGGALYAPNAADVLFDDIVVEGNSSRSGALFLKGEVTISNSQFRNNFASGGGAAVAVQGDLTISHSSFTHNTSNAYGGAIDNWDGDLLITDCDLSYNTARYGGALQTGVFSCEIRDSTFTHNRATGSDYGGGAIFLNEWPLGSGSQQSLTIQNSVFSNNEAAIVNPRPSQQIRTGGGAILSFAGGTVAISGSTFRENTVTGVSGANGGGLAFGSTRLGNFVISSSTIEDNAATGRGGGVYVISPTQQTNTVFSLFSQCRIAGNEAGDRGGGIHGYNVNLQLSELVNNHTTGAVAHGGGLSTQNLANLSESVVSGNYTLGENALGGGVYSGNLDGWNQSITRSTISGNNTVGANASGGGLFYKRRLSLFDSTVSGNQAMGAAAHGGGMYVDFLSATRSTIASNAIAGNAATGGGAYVKSITELASSIVARNLDAGMPSDISTNFSVTANWSLIGDTSGITFTGPNPVRGIGYLLNQDPALGPLAYNGGAMRTHLPLPGSPAIDAGDPSAVAGAGGVPEFDQRGESWSRVASGRIDMGAVEAQSNPLTGDYNFNGVVDAADYSMWMDTLGSTSDLRADGDGDGSVDADDYEVWKTHFGEVLEQGAGGMGQGVEDGEALAASQRLAGEGGEEIRSVFAKGEELTRNTSSRRAVRSRPFENTVAGENLDLLIASLARRAKCAVEGGEIKLDGEENESGAAVVDEVFARVGARRWR